MDHEAGANQNSNDRGSINDLPWASVFDPAANARAFTEIQAEGFRAASQLVDRFVRIASTGGRREYTAPQVHPGDGNGVPDDASPELERLMRSWWSIAGQFLRGSERFANATLTDRATLDLVSRDAGGALDVVAVAPGAASAEVWLHNRGESDLGEIRLRCSDLLCHDGGLINAAAVVFDPELVPMPARCSRGVAVRIEIAPEVVPGRYRGSVLAEGQPDLWLPVDVTVRRSAT